MKWALVVIGVAFIAGSVFADYKWKQWMAARRRERE
jgi:hypothetical protein